MRDDGRRRYAALPQNASRVHADIDAELAFDIDMRTRELIAQGVSPAAARERAVREFGDIEATRRYCAAVDASAARERRRTAWVGDLREDLILAWRGIRRAPAFALLVVVMLALGIGANTAVFSVVRRILIDRLPYRSAETLVRVYEGSGGSGFLTPRELNDLSASPAFAGVAAYGRIGGATYVGSQAAEIWAIASVTPNFFTVLGARALIGRPIDERDVTPSVGPGIVLSHALWQRVFGGDTGVVGRVIELSGGRRTIVGVMPAEFVSPTFKTDIWLPLDIRGALSNPVSAKSRGLRGIARLAPGVPLDRARRDGATIASRWREDRAGSPTVLPPRIVPLRDAMVGDVRPALLAVMGAAVMVLVITCINIAGLFLARATARRREIAVRAALGAGRGRLIRQLLTESAVYGLAGGALGVGLAFVVRDGLARAAYTALPNLGAIRIDAGMLATAAVVSILSGVAFGLLPAFAATRLDLRDSLGGSARGASATGGSTRTRSVLVMAQIALAVVLMVGAGLLLRSFARLVRTDLGYSSDDHVLTFAMDAPAFAAQNPSARNAFFSDALARVRALPGVTSAGMTTIAPWNGPNSVSSKTTPDADPATVPDAAYLTATEDYFAAVGTRILRGRSIRADDRVGAAPVALISEGLAERLFPHENAIGRRILFDGGGRSGEQWREVVGVVADVRPYADAAPRAAVYVSDWLEGLSSRPAFVVRTTGNAALLIPALQRMVHDLNPASPLMFPRTLRDVLHAHLAPQELSMMLMAVFATLALTLAALGVYAVMAYVVAARTREFGIRAALGAQRGRLMTLVLRQGMLAAGVGCVVGLLLAALGTRLIERLLSGVSTHDALTFAIAPIVLIVVTLAACLVPATAATRVQPVEALRAE